MYTGSEKLILDGKELPYSMLNFWQSSLSEILLNMNRGSFAEFIVRCALSESGFSSFVKDKSGFEPYDIDGPEMYAGQKQGIRPSRIEVKCSAYIQRWTKDKDEPVSKPDSSIKFSIAPAVMADENSDYVQGTPKTRNNDLYVFALYTAKYKACNMLNLDLWDFYVYPTYKINHNIDANLAARKTISLAKINQLGLEKHSFSSLCGAIQSCIEEINSWYKSESSKNIESS